MSVRTVAAAAVLVTVAAVGACAPPTSSDDDGGGGNASLPGADLSDVAVDTPGLVKQRKAAGIAACPELGAADPVDGGLPTLTLPCLGGGPELDLAALRGEPTVVNLWASSCGPCKDELPVLQRLHESGEVRVIGIDMVDPQPGTALELAADSGVTYPSIADPTGRSKEPLAVAGLPQSVFVRADGTIAQTERGAYTSYDDLAADVREHLGVAL